MSNNYPPGVSELDHECEECEAAVVAYGTIREDYYTYECRCGHVGEVIGYWQDRRDEQAIAAAKDEKFER